VFTNASIVDGIYVLGGSFTAGAEAAAPEHPESIDDPSTRYIMVAGSGPHLHNARVGELVRTRIERFDGLLSLRAAATWLVPDAENRPHHAEHDDLIARVDRPKLE
jgi:hypothetical protein